MGTATFDINESSTTSPPGDEGWTSGSSSYEMTDRLNDTYATPGGCTTTYTGSANGGGPLPIGTAPPAGMVISWDPPNDPYVYFDINTELAEEVTAATTGGDNCPRTFTYTNDVVSVAYCPDLPMPGWIGGRFVGKDNVGTISINCSGTTDGITFNATGSLTVGAPPPIKITSPPADKTIALTDAKYFTPQPGPTERQPAQRKLAVEGTAPTADKSITLNGVEVPVTGGKWRGELPITAAQLGKLTLSAGDGTTSAEQHDTLIDVVITNPAENGKEPVTDAPAMPALDAALNVRGYAGATAGVSFRWTLAVHGETVGRPGVWTGYTQTTSGSTTGASTAWKPAFAGIAGGVGRLTVTATLPDVLDNPVTSEPRWFGLPGTDPPAGTAKAYIDHVDRQYADPIRHLVCVESSWHQFNTAGYFPGNNGQPPIPGVPADWKPNPGLRQPLYGPPAGIGMAQLDPANLEQYWDWQANLQGGIGIWNRKLAEARAWRQHEQARLSARLATALRQADVNRAAHNPQLRPLHLNPFQVPPLTAKQLVYQAIRYYNGQQEYHYDADYVLSANGLSVNLVPAVRQWVGGTDPAVYQAPRSPDGHWGHPSADLRIRQPWGPYPANQNYVDQVRSCKNS